MPPVEQGLKPSVRSSPAEREAIMIAAILERCAGIDVGKSVVAVCLMTGEAAAEPRVEYGTYGTFTADLTRPGSPGTRTRPRLGGSHRPLAVPYQHRLRTTTCQIRARSHVCKFFVPSQGRCI